MGHPDENQSGRMRGVRNDTWARAPEMALSPIRGNKPAKGSRKSQERRRAKHLRKEELSLHAFVRQGRESPARVAEHRADKVATVHDAGFFRDGTKSKRRRSTWLDLLASVFS
jgi:hypothetical protein